MQNNSFRSGRRPGGRPAFGGTNRGGGGYKRSNNKRGGGVAIDQRRIINKKKHAEAVGTEQAVAEFVQKKTNFQTLPYTPS
jgi:hypothetical protein